MTSREHSSFNESQAIQSLTSGLKPFSGLVKVWDIRDDKSSSGHYTYNPQTEELHRHGD